MGVFMLFKKTECTNGWYGANCSQRCSGHCRDDTICNHVTGLCDKDVMLGGQGLSVTKVRKPPEKDLLNIRNRVKLSPKWADQ